MRAPHHALRQILDVDEPPGLLPVPAIDSASPPSALRTTTAPPPPAGPAARTESRSAGSWCRGRTARCTSGSTARRRAWWRCRSAPAAAAPRPRPRTGRIPSRPRSWTRRSPAARPRRAAASSTLSVPREFRPSAACGSAATSPTSAAPPPGAPPRHSRAALGARREGRAHRRSRSGPRPRAWCREAWMSKITASCPAARS